LNDFGLFPTYEPGVPIVLDIVLKNAIVVFLITTLTSTAYIGYRQLGSDKPLNLSAGLVWAAIALLMIALCIFGAVVVYRGLTRKSRFDRNNNGDTVVIGPLVHQCVGFFTGYLCGLLVIYPYMYIGMASEGAWAALVRALPWPMTPAIYPSRLQVIFARSGGGKILERACYSCGFATPGANKSNPNPNA
jgi:hypothetical protein